MLESEQSPRSHDRRYSALENDDDYDYALELRPDDAYRQSAEAMESIIDFEDLDFDSSSFSTSLSDSEGDGDELYSCIHTQQLASEECADSERGDPSFFHKSNTLHSTTIFQSKRTSRFDDCMTKLHLSTADEALKDAADQHEPSKEASLLHLASQSTDSAFGSSKHALSASSDTMDSSGRLFMGIISKQDFAFGLSLLEKHKKWAEKAARKSSFGLHQHRHQRSEKEAVDQFLLLLTRGVTVRRHQSRKSAEPVRLFSTTGGKLIQWEKPEVKDVLTQPERTIVPSTSTSTSAKNRSSFARAGVNMESTAFDCCVINDILDHEPGARKSSVSEKTSSAGFDHSLRHFECLQHFRNFGFKRQGAIKDLDIIDVHPATKEDPTQLGMYGTESLRGSKDVFNQQLTFSVVSRDLTSAQGYSTLDLECDEEDTYFVLIQGFRMLLQLAEQHKKSKQLLPEGSRESGRKKKRTWGEDLRRKRKRRMDPVTQLFEPSNHLDFLRAVQVGGGFLPTGRGVTSMVLSSTSRAHLSPLRSSTMNAAGGGGGGASEGPSQHLPPAQFLGWNSAGTQIWARLKMAGLDVKCVFSWDLRRVILKLRCPEWRLEEMAEQMHLKVKTRRGYMRKFKVSRRDSYLPMGSDGKIFRSSERQQIIDYIVRSKIKDGGAELDEYSEVGRHVVQSFPLHMYSRLNEIKHSWVTFWKREQPGEVAEPWSPFTQPYRTTYHRLRAALQHVCGHLLSQPLDSIAEYFGENIAFYFAYMAFYTRWLVFPSVLGFIVFCFQMSGRDLDNWLLIPYSAAVIVWACFMLVFWRQKQAALAYRWGVLDFETEESDRPQFRGEYVYDESSGEVHKKYSLWKRMGKYLVTFPVMVVSIFLVLLVMATVFSSQEKLLRQYRGGEDLDFSPTITFAGSKARRLLLLLQATATSRSLSIRELRKSNYLLVTFFYPCLYGILVSIITLVFDFVALWLNDFENHRTQTRYTNRLILKVFSFQFVTVFTSLYYYAFTDRSVEAAYFAISVTIFSLMTVGQWWCVFLNTFLPSVYQRALLYNMRANLSHTNRDIYRARSFAERQRKGVSGAVHAKLEKRMKLLLEARSKCWEEAILSKYDTFVDYNSAVIQIAFLLCFSAVFPLSPLIAMINNIFLIRVNAFKLCQTRQRPVAQKTGGIGVWEDVLQIMTVGGLLTNCALIGITSSQIRDTLGPVLGGSGIAILLFLYEQGVLLFNYWLHRSVPRVPLSVLKAQARERKSLERSERSKGVVRSGGGGGGGIGGMKKDEVDDFGLDEPLLRQERVVGVRQPDLVVPVETLSGGPRSLAVRSQSMVIGGSAHKVSELQRRFAEQKSVSDYALFVRSTRTGGEEKRVTFNAVPSLFSADRLQHRPLPPLPRAASADSDSEGDMYTARNRSLSEEEEEEEEEDCYVSAGSSEGEEEDGGEEGEGEPLELHRMRPMEQQSQARSMDPWDMRFSPDEATQSRRTSSWKAQAPLQSSPSRRGAGRELSSPTLASVAVSKLEEVIESLRNLSPPRSPPPPPHSSPPPPPHYSVDTSIPVPDAASPLRKYWLFPPRAASPSPSPLPSAQKKFLSGQKKGKGSAALASIAPLGSRSERERPSPSPALHPPSSHPSPPPQPVPVPHSGQGYSHGQASPVKLAMLRTRPPPSKALKAAYPEASEASWDQYLSTHVPFDRRSLLLSQHTRQRNGRADPDRGDVRGKDFFRKSDADERITRWKERLSSAQKTLLDRAQSPFSYLEHKDPEPSSPRRPAQSSSPASLSASAAALRMLSPIPHSKDKHKDKDKQRSPRPRPGRGDTANGNGTLPKENRGDTANAAPLLQPDKSPSSSRRPFPTPPRGGQVKAYPVRSGHTLPAAARNPFEFAGDP